MRLTRKTDTPKASGWVFPAASSLNAVVQPLAVWLPLALWAHR